MRKRICAALLALVMALSLLPATALAAEDNVHEVSNADEWNNAIKKIDEDDVREATIQLTGDVELKDVEEIGLEGVALISVRINMG